MSQADPLPADAPALLKLDPGDDVAVALRDLAAGERVESLPIAEAVPTGHKVALADLEAGATVRKFGSPIGRATQPIRAGQHVHSHNLATLLGGVEGYAFEPAPIAAITPDTETRFMGYRRPDGRVATRNEIWILPTVGCVARTADRIAAIAHARHAGTVDGVYAFGHPHGCSQLGEDLDGTRALLAALACHPNAGGVLLIGLGCESNQLDRLLEEIPESLRGRVRTLRAQSEEDEIQAGLAAVEALAARAALATRQPVALGELAVGLKCGGSDGFSGLTANPLVGRLADRVIGAGGSAILTEIPEIFGAERLLMARARDGATFDRLVGLVNDFKRYFIAHGQPVSENPSPGNISGGITTLEEKSLGAVQKAGRAPVSDVLRYGERLRRKGLTILEAPGNDAVSSTALAAAGATMILFTTGRGTPMGFPVPTVKIATNSALTARKPGWIDFDAGSVLAEGFEAAEEALVARIAAIASGAETAAERSGERDIAIWKRGVTL
ncbi:MAG: altronate dehydratase [Alphaproteobacteria bacterium]|nr:MAG: altronate dehydratase [Alphaproteobacteria bacterium]